MFVLQLGHTIIQRPIEHQSATDPAAWMPQHSQQLVAICVPVDCLRQGMHSTVPSAARKPACSHRTPLLLFRHTPSSKRIKFANLLPVRTRRSSLQDHHRSSVAQAREASASAWVTKFSNVSF